MNYYCFILLLLSSCSETIVNVDNSLSEEVQAILNTQGSVSSGATLYPIHCQECHGVSGGGSGNYPAINDDNVETLAVAIRNGQGTMEAFTATEISDQSAADIIAFIQDSL